MFKRGTDYKDTDKIMCPCCSELSTIQVWDAFTYSQAKNRQERRDYVSLTYSKAYHRLTDVWYRCNNCGEWTRGNVLMDYGCVLANEIER